MYIFYWMGFKWGVTSSAMVSSIILVITYSIQLVVKTDYLHYILYNYFTTIRYNLTLVNISINNHQGRCRTVSLWLYHIKAGTMPARIPTIWRILTFSDTFWHFLTFSDTFWHFLTFSDISDIFWHILTFSDTFWHFLTHSDIFWHILTFSDIFWHFLTHSDIFWHILTFSDIFWHFLTYSDIFWHILTFSDTFWHFLTHSDVFCNSYTHFTHRAELRKFPDSKTMKKWEKINFL